MPSYSTRTITACFVNKLRSRRSEGARHIHHDFFDEAGDLVASTVVSRGLKGSDSVSANLVGAYQRDLHLQGKAREFTQLIDCRLSRTEWLTLVGGTASDQPLEPPTP